jgi:hypothetical protein
MLHCAFFLQQLVADVAVCEVKACMACLMAKASHMRLRLLSLPTSSRRWLHKA